MTDEQNVAYVQAQTTCAMVEAMGMQAENRQREIEGKSMAYTHEHFYALIEQYGIHHNSLVTRLHNL